MKTLGQKGRTKRNFQGSGPCGDVFYDQVSCFPNYCQLGIFFNPLGGLGIPNLPS